MENNAEGGDHGSSIASAVWVPFDLPPRLPRQKASGQPPLLFKEGSFRNLGFGVFEF
jgi:hypothetical protein